MRLWKVPEIEAGTVARIARETGYPDFLCRVLAARGMTDPDAVRRYVEEDAALEDPFRLADMDKAVARIREALENGERICVYGDYDCDGITATALLTHYLQTVGADVIYYVPGRQTEGYGLNKPALDMLKGQRVDLLVTVDNGVSAHEEIAHAAALGMDVVVTDHHAPRDTLPEAVAVVNPHRADCPSAYKDLAGVGVAFKLIWALEEADGDEMLEYYSDLVTLGTIADVVPLTGENRVIVRHGLTRIPETEHPGLSALLQVSGLSERALTSESLAFGVIPRINAAGRMGVADDVIELLLTDDAPLAEEAAAAINGQNTQRKAVEDGILKEIEAVLEREPERLKKRVLLVSGKDWHHGVVGIVSAKLVERYGKPCIVFSLDGGEARGSGRSVKGFSLIEAIAACSQRLTRYGGHTLAAGLTIPAEFLDAFDQSIQAFAQERYPVMPLPELAADCSLEPGELTVANLETLSKLEPFGAENEAPLFHIRGLVILGVYPTSDGKHIRIRFQGGGESFYAVYFRMSGDRFPYAPGDAVEIMAKASAQVYNGKMQLSVKIADLRPVGVPQQAMLEGWERYAGFQREESLSPEAAAALLPNREEIGLVYKFLRRAGVFSYGTEALYFRLAQAEMHYCKVLIALDVLEEMGFVRRSGQAGAEVFTVVPDAPKADLKNSSILCRLSEQIS